MLITVAIPCYNSEKMLSKVVYGIKEEFVRQGKKFDYQIILINDGSADNTFEVIRSLCKEDNKIIGLDLSKNHGQASARMTALPYVTGEILVYMDDDGQHSSEDIFKIIERIEAGYDLVYAKFIKKKHSFFKTITSNLYRSIQQLMGVCPKGVFLSSFFAMNRICIEALKEYDSPYPSMSSFLCQVTNKIGNVDAQHYPRISGTTGYSLKKLFALWITVVTNFTIIPLRIASFLGFCISAIGIISGIVLTIRKLLMPEIALGYTSLMATILFVGGMILITTGLLGEYVGRVYIILNKKPQYTIRERINIDYKELKK